VSGRDDRPVVDFDHHRPVSERHPDVVYQELREKCPVAWTEQHGGYWVVTKHSDVAQIFKDHKRFSSTHNASVPEGLPFTIPPVPMGAHIPEDLDPPEFHAYRRLFNGVLSPNHVAALTPRIRHWVSYYIDRVIESGEVDLVKDIAAPLPAAVTLEWLGFPERDWQRISDAFHDMASLPATDPRAQEAFLDLAWLDGRITEEVDVRRSRPRNDAMSYFVHARIDGVPIASDYVEGMIRILVGGGVETTTSAITSTLLHLGRHPEDRQRLIDEPELWATAGEEFLRRYPPVRTHARTVVVDTEISGCLMRAGERVLLSEGSACQDEDAFPDAERVILDRFPNRHLAFGLGIHRCAGMHLAREELKEVVGQVLRRMPDYEIDETKVLAYPSQPMASGYKGVTAKFTPGRRSTS
jgi:cytochrome P450